MEFIQREQVAATPQAISVNSTTTLMAQLESEVEQLYLRSSSVCEKEPTPLLVSSTMQPKYDEGRQSNLYEFETTTPMSCSVSDSVALLWRGFTSERVRHACVEVLCLFPTANVLAKAASRTHSRKTSC